MTKQNDEVDARKGSRTIYDVTYEFKIDQFERKWIFENKISKRKVCEGNSLET